MTQRIDVLAVFDMHHKYPKPVKFNIMKHGRKVTYPVTTVNNVEWINIGGERRLVYFCSSGGNDCRLHYFSEKSIWELDASPL